jgi:hypothetical protein
VAVPYLVREWFEGESLASELDRRRAEKKAGRSPDEVMALLEPVFDGVAYAHAQGVAHLSLHPSNMFLAARGGGKGASLKVLDFGVARTMNDLVAGIGGGSASAEGLRVLFPAYAAPEQLDKKVGAPGTWTDVYALALVVMELLSDRVVMNEAETGALVERALDAKRRPTPQAHGLKLANDLARTLARAVSLAPEQRQKDAAELWRDLRAAVQRPRSGFAPAPQPRSPTLIGPGLPGDVGAPRLASQPVPEQPAVSAPPPLPEPAPAETPLPVLAPPPLLAPPPAVSFDAATPPACVLPAASSTSSGHFALVAEPRPALSVSQPRLPLPAWGGYLQAALRMARRQPMRAVAIASMVVGVALFLVVSAVLFESGPRAAAATLAAAHPPPPPPPEPTGRFSVATAWRALFAKSHDVSGCRRNDVWGGTTATVIFGNDGSVSRVAFRPPFTGSETGRCVADVLESAHITPFAGKPGAVQFWLYVAPRP